MKAQADSNDRLGALIHAALEDGRSSTFEASLASLGIRSRSPQVQRVVNLITTALKQDAPLKDLLYSLSQDYDRLNQLMDRRETELSGYSMMTSAAASAITVGISGHRIRPSWAHR